MDKQKQEGEPANVGSPEKWLQEWSW